MEHRKFAAIQVLFVLIEYESPMPSHALAKK